jgi:uncharacterized membrane protein YdbT with pleckstrin-like domain
MAYPQRLLSAGESIEAEFRPHWSGLLREGLILLVGVAIAVVMVIVGAPPWTYLALLLLVFLFTAKGAIKWFTTLHVITDERVIYRAGFIAKSGKEIPLEVINDVAFNQTIFEKLFGTGDLMIESAGTHGQTRYRDIPKPEEVQSLLYRVRETRMLYIKGGQDATPAESTASQLDRLSRLHDEGKLTNEEFDQEKKKLLGGN